MIQDIGHVSCGGHKDADEANLVIVADALHNSQKSGRKPQSCLIPNGDSARLVTSFQGESCCCGVKNDSHSTSPLRPPPRPRPPAIDATVVLISFVIFLALSPLSAREITLVAVKESE